MRHLDFLILQDKTWESVLCNDADGEIDFREIFVEFKNYPLTKDQDCKSVLRYPRSNPEDLHCPCDEADIFPGIAEFRYLRGDAIIGVKLVQDTPYEPIRVYELLDSFESDISDKVLNVTVNISSLDNIVSVQIIKIKTFWKFLWFKKILSTEMVTII